MTTNCNRQLLVIPPGSLSSKDKERLTRAGFIWIESADPAAIRLVSAEAAYSPISSNDLLVAALAGLCEVVGQAHCPDAVRVFVRYLHKAANSAMAHTVEPPPRDAAEGGA